MAIAILGWGSLIWCPGNLRMKGAWRQDGPELPIEFARISTDGRLTLVLLAGATPQRTYWVLSEFATIVEARRNLKEREQCRTADVHFVAKDGGCADETPPAIRALVTTWLGQRPEIDGVVWTGLPSNWIEKRAREFTQADAVTYITELEAAGDAAKTKADRAREYITNAPPLVDTEVRRQLRRLGWRDAQLSATLFESASAVALKTNAGATLAPGGDNPKGETAS
jgi:hypothetical protein